MKSPTPPPNSNSSMYIKNKLTILLCCLVVASCSNQSARVTNATYDALKQLAPGINAATKAIIVVDDNSCIGCNQAFAGFITSYLNRKDVIFIVSANPNKVDISPFLEPGLHNVYNDYRQTLFTQKIITSSTIFLLRPNHTIDTAITINPQSVGSVGRFLEGRLK
jgi:hypothetical protein